MAGRCIRGPEKSLRDLCLWRFFVWNLAGGSHAQRNISREKTRSALGKKNPGTPSLSDSVCEPFGGRALWASLCRGGQPAGFDRGRNLGLSAGRRRRVLFL